MPKKVQVLTAGGAASSVLPSTKATTSRSGGSTSINNTKQAPQNTTGSVVEEQQQHLEYEDASEEVQPPQSQSQSQSHDEHGHAPYRDNVAATSPARSMVDVDVNSPMRGGGVGAGQGQPPRPYNNKDDNNKKKPGSSRSLDDLVDVQQLNESSITISSKKTQSHDLIWLLACFVGIMASFVCYGLLLEYTTSGGRKLHELSFLFVTSGLYTLTAAAGRYVRDETPTTIPPARFAVLGLTSMGSTFCSVRSLRYVIYPIQVLAKSCKPVPVMIMGTFMGKRYPMRKYINVVMIVIGVALFMGGGSEKKKGGGASGGGDDDVSTPSQMFGILLLFISLCFDGGTGAYEDKLMSVHSVGPFDLMYNIQLGKTILAGVGLLVFNQLHLFIQMVQEMGFLLVALGLSGALGQVFIFVTIAKFGALTCSIIGLARKVTTLVASIYFYGHSLNSVQFIGLVISVTAMVMNFWGKSNKKGGGHGHHGPSSSGKPTPEEMQKMLGGDSDDSGVESDSDVIGGSGGDVELAKSKYSK